MQPSASVICSYVPLPNSTFEDYSIAIQCSPCKVPKLLLLPSKSSCLRLGQTTDDCSRWPDSNPSYDEDNSSKLAV